MTYRLAIFDFDGTLSDSFPWFLGIVNSVADRFDFRRIAPDEVEGLRGLEAREILRRLEVPLWKLPLIATHMRRLKLAHGPDIPLFPGASEMLRELSAHGMTLAVVTSDSEASVRAALGAEVAGLVAAYACGASLFGKAAKFRSVLKRTGVAPEAAIAIGDEMRDADAAAQAGIAFGAVAWGYASITALETKRPALVFRNMGEIVAKLT